MDSETQVAELRKTFRTGRTLSYNWRISQLNHLQALLEENQDEIIDALHQDLHKPRFESAFTEIIVCVKEIIDMKRNLARLMKPKSSPRDLVTSTAKLEIRSDPYGVCLVMGAWNYPFQLVIAPLIGAIAAGNCVLLKPSELAPVSAKIIARLVDKYLDNDCIQVTLLDRVGSAALLKECRFDMIFFTGGCAVGRIIMTEAAKHLTPCILELGGKCPLYIDDKCDLDYCANRIVGFKSFNAGQICINVDYILCSERIQEKLIPLLQKKLKEAYPDGQKNSPDYSRIINHNHFDRLKSLVDTTDGEICLGNVMDCDRDDKYIPLLIYKNVSSKDSLMKNEIFGPLLPIVPICNSVDDAIDFINDGEKPLAAYIFSKRDDVINRYLTETTSGNCTVNDMGLHFVSSLPFGGVGNSGIGAYHGDHSFDAFSHQKGIYHQSTLGKSISFLASQPYTNFKYQAMKAVFYGPPFDYAALFRASKFLFEIGVYAICGYYLYTTYYK